MRNEVKNAFQEYKGEDSDIKEILSRGSCFCENNPKEVLVAGINPSYDRSLGEGSFEFPSPNEQKGYFKNIQEMLGSLTEQTAYLDLFPVRLSSQKEFMKLIDKDLSFFAKLLAITQKEIERLAPKLIIVNNSQARAFWGANKKSVWMGYQLEEYCKELNAFRITGFKDDPMNERVYKIEESNLVNSIIVLYGLYDNRHKAKYPEKILNPEIVKKLLLEAEKI